MPLRFTAQGAGDGAVAERPHAALQAYQRAADPTIKVRLDLANKVLKINRDFLNFTVTTGQPGYLYLLNVGTDGKFYQLFPSKNDPENLLEPGVHRFPRGKLGLQALGPEGKEYFWAYLSPTRKSFAGALMGNGPYAAAPATVSTVRSLGEVMLSGRFGASDVATIVEVD